MKHTPGPWRISGFEVNTNAKNRVVMGGDDFSVCHVGERSRQENIANSNLIAAAPKMLEVLKAWEHWYSGDSSEFNRDTAREAGLRSIAEAETT